MKDEKIAIHSRSYKLNIYSFLTEKKILCKFMPELFHGVTGSRSHRDYYTKFMWP